MKFLPSKPLIQEDVVGGLTTARVAGLEREVLKQKVLRIMYMNLAFTIDQAKMNGWHTESREGAGSRRNERSVPIPPFHNRVTMALEIAQAMRYLHEQKPKVIHRT
ncbi:hypothetical protein OIU77_031133 [Salix suchowensis]|uniref:Protein kinase domain-containing protein n=1 Tax=Salix suchowensis TaxID=1278906 RepID=A0ABQ9BHH1_9ROSI|nr:hypothetical protein OIU77_031133 [Salix suchowensis]